MPTRTSRATRPPELDRKRPADAEDDPGRVDAEVDAEDDDGTVTLTLETDNGSADIAVPPAGTWRSSARNALFSRMDDLTWAGATLSAADFREWARLDPTQEDVTAFFEAWGEKTGQQLGESRASRRRSARTTRR